MTTIARGDIEVNLNDAEVIAGLRAVDSQFDRTMRKIEHSRAEATVDADLKPLDRKLAEAKAKLDRFRSMRAHKLMIDADADTSQLDRKMAAVDAKIKYLTSKRAVIKLDVEGQREAVRAMQQLEDLQNRANVAQGKRNIAVRQEAADVARLQQQYGRLTDRIERLAKQRPIGREARAKVELDVASTYLQMEALKAKLHMMGSRPPVDIKVDVDRRGAMLSWLKNIGNRAAKLSDLTVRLGPFTTSIKGLVTALGFLGPTITDLLGAAGALVGTLGAGIAGAATIGAGAVTGFAMAAGGLLFSLRNTKQEVTNARTAINGYQKAVQQYGKGSDQAKKKQDQLNNTLKSISPLARETATGIERFYSTWDKHTGQTQKNFGRIAHAGFQALDAITPMWAQRTNELSTMLADGLTKGFKFLGSGAGRGALSSISADFNRSIPGLLHGLGAFGQGFLNTAVQGAHALSMLTGGIDSLGQKFLSFTQGNGFSATIHSWVMQARDLMRFFGALTRVAVHFFGAGSKAGQGMVENMTNALNRWDKFLTSVSGKNQVATAFTRAAHGATALWHALAPLAGAFLMWANNLSPFVTGVLQGVGFVARLTGKLTELLGLGGPLATLGATMGAMWAVGKIGAFVAFLSRIPKLLAEIKAAGSLGGMLSALGSMNAGKLTGSGSIIEGGKAAAVEMQAGIEAGGAAAAAELRAAMIGGGAAAAGEEAVGSGLGVGGAAAAGLGATAAGEAAVGAEAVGAGAAVGGLTVATGGLILVGAAAAVGLGLLARHFLMHKGAADKLTVALKANREEMAADNAVISGQVAAQDKAVASHKSAVAQVKNLKDALKNASKGTVEYNDLANKLWFAENKLKTVRQEGINAAHNQRAAANTEAGDIRKQIGLSQQQTAQKIRGLQADRQAALSMGNIVRAGQIAAQIDAARSAGAAASAALERQLASALNARAAATLNAARAAKGMTALSGKNAQQLGSLAQARPNLAQNIAVKFQNPTNAGNVAAAAKRALGQGVSIKTVVHIVADSSNAEQALRRIRTAEVAKKMLRVGITGHDGVLSKLSQIDQKSIKQKIARIIQHGGEPTLSMIERIIQKQIANKSFSIQAAVSQAIAQINLVEAGLSRVQSKSITISATHIDTFMTRGNPRSGHASGREPQPGYERALVGEGKAPEHIIDPVQGWSWRTNGPTVVDLSPGAYVIPTEDAYRGHGKTLLQDAARDLGMGVYKGGRGKKKYKHLPIMRDGSITTDYFSSRQQATRDAYNRYATRTDTLEKQYNAAYTAMHRAKTPTARKNAKTRVDDIEKEMHGRVAHGNKLKRTAETASKRYNRYATDQNEIETYTSQMNTAATQYNQTGKPEFLTAWNTAKGLRRGAYTDLVKLIKARDDATGDKSKWKSELNKILAGAQSDETTADADEAPTGPFDSLDNFIQFLGRGSDLTGLNTQMSLAGLTTPTDDDITAATNLQAFYGQVLESAKGTGNVGLIGMAADQLKTANSTLADLTAPGAGSTAEADQQAINDQLQTRLGNMTRANAINEAFIQTSLGPGDIGTAQYPNAGSAAANITINTLHPGDPATLDAIGRAATSGLSYQSSVSSPREVTGM